MNGYLPENKLLVTNEKNIVQQNTHFYVKRHSIFALGKSKYTISSDDECFTGTVSFKKMNTIYDMNNKPQFKFQYKSKSSPKELLFSGGEENDEIITVKFIKNSSSFLKSYQAQFYNKATNRNDTILIKSDNFGTFNQIYYGDENGLLIGTIRKANMVQMSFSLDIYPGVDKFLIIAIGFCIDRLFNAKVGRLGAAAAVAI